MPKTKQDDHEKTLARLDKAAEKITQQVLSSLNKVAEDRDDHEIIGADVMLKLWDAFNARPHGLHLDIFQNGLREERGLTMVRTPSAKNYFERIDEMGCVIAHLLEFQIDYSKSKEERRKMFTDALTSTANKLRIPAHV